MRGRNMGQALYRKYRSKKLSEIVGQEHITSTLERAVKLGTISHAYLFTGPRGVGKTSIARILAHEINDLPYTDESIHLDIIEIDAASNRRIDEIRDLRDKVHIAPTSSRYKVYIIDEVHMLTKEAFNALLKTLEEPPAHVVFILATTEMHKLPETIVSRTQRFTFKAIGDTVAIEHLRSIAKSEGMDVDDQALALIADHGNGSFRDSISLLDQVGHSKKTINRNDVEKLVGIAPSEHIEALLLASLQKSPAAVVTALDQLIADGISASQAAKQLSVLIRSRIIAGESNQAFTTLLADLLQVSGSSDPLAQLEIALFQANITMSPSPKKAVKAPTRPNEVSIDDPVLLPEQVKTTQSSEKPNAKSVTNKVLTIREKNKKPTEQNIDEIILPENWWNEVLNHVKKINNTLYGVLKMAKPELDGQTIQLQFAFAFHQKKVADAATKTKIRDAIISVVGRELSVEAIHKKTTDKSIDDTVPSSERSTKSSQGTDSEFASITTIFGGGEVLET